jgi:hypothetical protein
LRNSKSRTYAHPSYPFHQVIIPSNNDGVQRPIISSMLAIARAIQYDNTKANTPPPSLPFDATYAI